MRYCVFERARIAGIAGCRAATLAVLVVVHIEMESQVVNRKRLELVIRLVSACGSEAINSLAFCKRFQKGLGFRRDC